MFILGSTTQSQEQQSGSTTSQRRRLGWSLSGSRLVLSLGASANLGLGMSFSADYHRPFTKLPYPESWTKCWSVKGDISVSAGASLMVFRSENDIPGASFNIQVGGDCMHHFLFCSCKNLHWISDPTTECGADLHVTLSTDTLDIIGFGFDVACGVS